MSTETAQIVLYAIATVEFIVWLAAMQFVSVAYKSEKVAAQEAMQQFGLDKPPSGRLVVGSAEVEGQPAALAAKAASILAKGGPGALGPVKILAKTDNRITFEGIGYGGLGQPSWRSVCRGQMQFASAGPDRTTIDYAVELQGGKGLLLGGAVCVVLALVALVAGFTLIHIYVVPDPHPAVRAQAIQMFQAVHFLWPPFLFGGLYRGLRRNARVGFEIFVHNLPYSSA
jgi:hypothetical protein